MSLPWKRLVGYSRRGLSALFGAALLLGAGAGLGPASAATNLVANGDFDDPTVTDPDGYVKRNQGATIGAWTVGSGSVDHVGSFWTAASPTQSIDLNGSGAGSIYQDVATTAGQWYVLRFALAGNPDTYCGPQGIKRMEVHWAGAVVATLAFDTTSRSLADMGWTYYQVSVQASAATSRLKFQSLTGTCAGPALDDVWLTELPPDPTEWGHNQPDPNGSTGGDPVHTFTGVYTYSHTDVAIPGRGPSAAFARTYNSNDASGGVLGPGWTHSYAARLSDPGDGSGDWILVGPLGRADRYTKNANGSFTPPPGVATTLVANGNGTYTATHRDQTTWTFDSVGKLTRIADRYTNESILTYTGSQLTSITDPAGRGSLALSYDTCFVGRLCQVSDWQSPTPRVVQFQYGTSGRLWKVTDREGKVTRYCYQDDSDCANGIQGGTSHRLISLTDANSHTAITLTYDAQGRVATQKDARGLVTGLQTTFAYVTNPDGTRTTTVTSPATSFEPGWSPTVEDTYDSLGRISRRVSRPSSTETLTEQYSYDVSSNRSSVTDARGYITNFCYDVDSAGAAIPVSRGNLTRRIDPRRQWAPTAR